MIAPAIATAKPDFPNEEEGAAPDDSDNGGNPPGSSQSLVVASGSKLLADVNKLVGKAGMVKSVEVDDSVGTAVLVCCRSKSSMQVFRGPAAPAVGVAVWLTAQGPCDVTAVWFTPLNVSKGEPSLLMGVGVTVPA